MFRILESQAPARQTATDTISTLSSRLQSAGLLEDRRAAILGLRSFAKEYPASVASGALRPLISSLKKDVEDVDTIKIVLETLLGLFAPDQNSPEASDEIALWLADEFTQRQDNITSLLDLLDTREFYSRLYSLQLITHISDARPERTQECIFTAPLGVSRLVGALSDIREPVRNEALLLLITLTPSSTELQKVVAFENAFERGFVLIEAEGSLTHGTEIVSDCLSLFANLLRLNLSNQSYFRETGCVSKLAALLADVTTNQEIGEELPQWTLAHRNRNIWGVLAIVQLFLVKGGISTPANQISFWKNGVMEQALRIAFSPEFDTKLKSMAFLTCAHLIRGNHALQEQFADIEVAISRQPRADKVANGDAKPKFIFDKINVLEALLRLTLEPGSVQILDVRLASCECIKAFFAAHSGIRLHFLGRAIEGHTSGQDLIPNIFTLLLQPPVIRGNADPYQLWFAAVLLFHLVFEYPEGKALASKVTEGDETNGEEVITCVQAISGNLVTGMQRGDDERISIGYMMLLCGWLFEEPDVVNDFLTEGSSIQSLIQETKLNLSPLLSGFCAILLGVAYEFSSKDSPISRSTLHELITVGLGRELYIDKITKFRELDLVRDFEVLPQTTQGLLEGLPDIYFDRTFIEFIKDNFSRLIRAIDRNPGIEISVITNGIEKGVSRELVDTLRTQAEDRGHAIQKLESEGVILQQKLEQEQSNHEKTRHSFSAEINRLKATNESLEKQHAEELTTLQTQYNTDNTSILKKHQQEISMLEKTHISDRNSLLKQCNEQLEKAHSQLKSIVSDYEKKAAKVREQHEAESKDLKTTITILEMNIEKARQDHTQSLQRMHEEYSSKLSAMETRVKSAEERADGATKDLQTAHEDYSLKLSAMETRVKSAEERTDVLTKDLQTAHEDYSSKLSAMETRVKSAEERADGATKDLQTAHEDYSLKLSRMETRTKRTEEQADEADKTIMLLQKELKDLQDGLKQAQTEAEKNEDDRKAVQGELDDLLIVFSDLEAKRSEDKKRLKALGEEISEAEDSDDNGDAEVD